MLDEIPKDESSSKPTKVKSLIGLAILAILGGLFLFLLYQALTNQIKS